MKLKLIILLFSISSFISCDTKNQEDLTVNDKPFIVSASFFCAYAGSNSSDAVKVNITIPIKGSIQKLSLHTKTGTEVYHHDNPETGEYILYHHIGDCDGRFPQGAYHFVFTRKDGTKVITEGYPK